MYELYKFNIFHEISSKCMKIPWILYLKWEMGELSKLNIFHEISSKCMKITWISYLVWKMLHFESFIKCHQNVWKYLESYKWNGWTFEIYYFSWMLIKLYENNLNLKSEMSNFQNELFFMKTHESVWKYLQSYNWNGWTFKVQYFL